MSENLIDSEAYARDKAITAIGNIRKSLNELLEDIDGMEDSNWNAIFLDAERRKSMMLLLPQLEKLADNLGHSRMLTLIASVLLKERD